MGIACNLHEDLSIFYPVGKGSTMTGEEMQNKNQTTHSNRSGKNMHRVLMGLSLLTGFSLVSTPTACGTSARLSREPIAETGDNLVTNAGNSNDNGRVEVEPQIAQVSPLREATVSGEDPLAVRSDAKIFEVKDNPSFCSGLQAGECLTLVIQVPSSLVQSSLGLGALGLALAAKDYNDLLHRTCSEGLRVGLPVIEAGLPVTRRNGVARKLFSPFKRARCVYQVLASESVVPPAERFCGLLKPSDW
ncbi:hypothetical protein EBU99_10485 [bacterium]|nr:hypothetical protein [bacterium]